ncbi:EGF and SEA domain containing protein-like protein, partial [Leptotrombidium deliense]
AIPITVVETSEKIDKSTIYSTLTFYATLFNGSQSTITPIEETKTEVLTLREPIKITRTIYPTQTIQKPSLYTRTYFTTYTNMVTFYDKEVPVTSEIKETVSNIVTYTLPGYELPKTQGSSSLPVHTHQPYKIPSPSLVTRNTYTTLTHFITLFSGSNTILSSIEEVSPTVITEIAGETQAPKIDVTDTGGFKIRKTYGEQSLKPSRDLMTAFVPSISTLYTTHTFFTTFFSGTTSVISSREATTSSLVTLYVPYSVAVKATQTIDAASSASTVFTPHYPDSSFVAIDRAPETNNVQPTPSIQSSIANINIFSSFDLADIAGISSGIAERLATSQLPSLRLESSRYEELESSIISSVFENLKSSQGLNEDQISSVLFNINAGKSTTTIDGSTVVFLTDLLFKPHIIATTSDGAAATDAPIASITIPLRGLSSVIYPAPTVTGPSASVANNNVKPGAVIELNDLLSGSSSNYTGNLGAAIKDIVKLISVGAHKYNNNKNKTNFERVESSKVTIPVGGVTVTQSKDAIYIPIGAAGHNDTSERHAPHPVLPVFIPPSIPPFSEVAPVQESGEKKQPVYIPPVKEIRPTTTEADPTETLAPIFHKPEESDPKVKIAAGTPRKSQLNFRRFDQKERQKESSKKADLAPTLVESSLATEEVKTTKATPSLTLPDGSKGGFTQVSSGATTIFFVDGPETNAEASDQKTKYVTSVESITRTLTLTSTKVYYTRDSPLTITSEFTTTIPPRTFVSTIIGSRTILGTAGEATKTVDIEATHSEQTEARTTVTTTTLIFNSITTTVVRTLVIPTAIEATKPSAPSTGQATKTVSQRPTRRPIVPYRGRVRPSSTPAPSPIKPPRPRVPYVYKKPTTSSTPSYSEDNEVTAAPKSAVHKEPSDVIDDDQCRPACNTAGNEICKEFSGKYKCDCRPGFARKTSNSHCEEMQSYIVIVRVMKVNETPIDFKNEFKDKQSAEFQEFAKLTENEIDKAYKLTSLKDNYIASNVNQINKTNNGVLVNFTIHLSHNDELNEDLLLDELTKSLEEAESLPIPAAISAEVENVMDLDECSDSSFNDCDRTARCINEIGSYKCECKDGFPDLNPALPGRTCAAEIKNCEFCHSRGDCVRSDAGDATVCKCQRMYLGRHCEINGIRE